MPDTTTHRTSADLSNPTAPIGPSPQGSDGRDLLTKVASGAHGAVDTLADKAAPAMQKIESGMTQANEAMHEGANRMREMGDEWTHSMRDTVREHPLSSLLVALAAGALIARIAR